MTIIKCKRCGRQYGYELWGTVYPGGKDREIACCPYCGEEGYSKMTSQCISVYKLDVNGEPVLDETDKNL